MSVYSTRFIIGVNETASPLMYQVPAGHTAIIRDAEAYNNTAATPLFFLGIYVSGLLQGVFAANPDIPRNSGAQWQGRVVLNATDQLIVNAGGDGIFVIVSGYLFAN